jgi:hypothetical protein
MHEQSQCADEDGPAQQPIGGTINRPTEATAQPPTQCFECT